MHPDNKTVCARHKGARKISPDDFTAGITLDALCAGISSVISPACDSMKTAQSVPLAQQAGSLARSQRRVRTTISLAVYPWQTVRRTFSEACL